MRQFWMLMLAVAGLVAPTRAQQHTISVEASFGSSAIIEDLPSSLADTDHPRFDQYVPRPSTPTQMATIQAGLSVDLPVLQVGELNVVIVPSIALMHVEGRDDAYGDKLPTLNSRGEVVYYHIHDAAEVSLTSIGVGAAIGVRSAIGIMANVGLRGDVPIDSRHLERTTYPESEVFDSLSMRVLRDDAIKDARSVILSVDVTVGWRFDVSGMLIQPFVGAHSSVNSIRSDSSSDLFTLRAGVTLGVKL